MSNSLNLDPVILNDQRSMIYMIELDETIMIWFPVHISPYNGKYYLFELFVWTEFFFCAAFYIIVIGRFLRTGRSFFFPLWTWYIAISYFFFFKMKLCILFYWMIFFFNSVDFNSVEIYSEYYLNWYFYISS